VPGIEGMVANHIESCNGKSAFVLLADLVEVFIVAPRKVNIVQTNSLVVDSKLSVVV